MNCFYEDIIKKKACFYCGRDKGSAFLKNALASNIALYNLVVYPKHWKMRVDGKRVKALSIDGLCDWPEREQPTPTPFQRRVYNQDSRNVKGDGDSHTLYGCVNRDENDEQKFKSDFSHCVFDPYGDFLLFEFGGLWLVDDVFLE